MGKRSLPVLTWRMGSGSMPTMKGKLGWVSIFLLAWFIGCGGEGAVGDECGEAGVEEGECEAGSVCGDDGSGEFYCLQICTDQADCPGGKECNGVSGTSTKGCRTP